MSIAIEPVPAVRSGQRIIELDGLRAFAILPVLLYHCVPREGSGLSWFATAGWMGVDLFFVLSGFLITGILVDTAGRPGYYRTFILRRTLRIFPLYYLCLALFFTTAWIRHGTDADAGWFAAYLGNFRLAWLNGWPTVGAFSPLWSLQVEEQFYLFYPLIVLLLPVRNLKRLLIACMIVAPLLRVLLAILFPDASVARYVLTPCRMDALAAGGLVSLLWRSGAIPPGWLLRWGFAILASVSIALYMLGWLADPAQSNTNPLMSTIGYSIIALAAASLLMITLSCPPPALLRLFRWRPLVYTGSIAYGLYLLHMPATWAGKKLILLLTSIVVPDDGWLAIPVSFLSAFAAAALSWRFLESPILALKERLTPR